jgi:hypothetical protein
VPQESSSIGGSWIGVVGVKHEIHRGDKTTTRVTPLIWE